MAAPPYLTHRRVLQWIMKWIMQMPHNIFILTKVEVHAPVPRMYEYERTNPPEPGGMCYHLMKTNPVCGSLLLFGSFVNLFN